MITNRLTILLAVLLGGLSTVFLLPKQLFYQPVGVNLTLPESVGVWEGKDEQITEKEIGTLGPETQFARKTYTNGLGDELHVTIVLAGHDMNTSIHRPERCLTAQGWDLVDSGSVRVPLASGAAMEATRLHDMQMFKSAEHARGIPVYNLDYYWFVGYSDITNSHTARYWMDIRDRILHGYNQRWAYFTVAATVTEGLRHFGRDEKQTDALIQDFIKKLVPLTHKDTVHFAHS
jgi:EpsI family protein